MAININKGSTPQDQMDAIDRQIASFNGVIPANRMASVQALYDQRNALSRQITAAQPAQIDPAKARVDAARKKMYDLSEGRLGELRSDPVDAQVIKELQDRISGKTNPYDETTRNAMVTQQAEMAGQIERNQLAGLSAHGGSAADPSYQAGVAEAMAGRQAAAQKANLDINSKANLANYDAKNQALSGLGAFNMSHNAAITDQTHDVANRYEKDYSTKETPAPINNYTLPDFSAWQQFAQSQTNPAATAPKAAPVMTAPAAQPAAQPGPWKGVPYPYKPAPAVGGAAPAPAWQGVPYPYQPPKAQPQNQPFVWKPTF